MLTLNEISTVGGEYTPSSIDTMEHEIFYGTHGCKYLGERSIEVESKLYGTYGIYRVFLNDGLKFAGNIEFSRYKLAVTLVFRRSAAV